MVAKKKSAVAVADPVIVVDELVIDQGTFAVIPLDQIRISKTNRKHFNALKMTELAASIKEIGVAQPILIRPVTPTAEEPQIYEVVAGERRFRGSQMAGRTTIPAMIRVLTDLQAAKIQIFENLHREDPHELEEALGYQALMLSHGYSADQLVTELKKSRSYIYSRLKLCSLAASLHDPFLDGKIDASTALLLARIPVPDLQVKAYMEIIKPSFKNEPLTVREAQTHIRNRYMLDLTDAIFDIKSATLTDAPACGKCPKRTGNQPEVFPDINPDLCTDPDCFTNKIGASVENQVRQYERKNIPVFRGEEFVEALQAARNGSGEYITHATWITAFPRHHSTSKSKQAIGIVLSQEQLGEPVAYALSDSNNFTPFYSKDHVQEELEKAGYCDNLMQAFDKTAANYADVYAPEKQATTSAADVVIGGATLSAKTSDAYLRKQEQDKILKERADKENKFRYHLYHRVRTEMALSADSPLINIIPILGSAILGDYRMPDAELQEYYETSIADEDDAIAYLDRFAESSLQFILDITIGNHIEVNEWNIDDVQEDYLPWKLLNKLAKAIDIDPDKLRTEFETPVDATPFKRPLLTLKKKVNPAPVPESQPWPFPTQKESAGAA
ncbi:ParB/RepB/Spo0J family partition protein [Undibacterium sp. CY21W]|uniref:ParB/RepB/Spo0J family partition protein n=1 Tax=Undibacterium sp. CY21W TaxID=2762293 RepID=UPI00164A679E|nr:ParB/RepB/Spo0J family partition protein [Undibacterium sp. CY21W]MBC3927805.1 ParB/RepB/Spo0J family partition protein [Undibacterium sp. CY21W]